jgi:hypothetical protein
VSMSRQVDPLDLCAVKVVDELPLPARKTGKHSFGRINEQVKERLLEKQRMKQMCNKLATYDVQEAGLFSNKFLLLEEDPVQKRSAQSKSVPESNHGKSRSKRKRKSESKSEDRLSIDSTQFDSAPSMHLCESESSMSQTCCEEHVEQEAEMSERSTSLADVQSIDAIEPTNDNEQIDPLTELNMRYQLKQLERDYAMYCQYGQGRRGVCSSRVRFWLLGAVFVALYAYTVKICLELFCPCAHRLSFRQTFNKLFRLR